MCIDCIKVNVDITDGIKSLMGILYSYKFDLGISKENIIHSCRECGRFLHSQNQWLYAEVESKELLSLCLKKIRGLNKVYIVNK